MDTKSFDILEYKRVRTLIASHCMSEEGKVALEAVMPSINKEEIDRLKGFASEWTILIERGEKAGLQAWPTVSHLFPVLMVTNAVLDLEQLFDLAQFCKVAIEIPESIGNLQLTYTAEKDNPLPALKEPLEAISHIIDQNGQLRDLPQLREIKAAIAHIRHDIEQRMKSYTHDVNLQSALQSTVPAFRDGRQVLAVKTNFRGRIAGIVHELSQTGQTLYLEPTDIVMRNNDLIQEEYRLAIEIRRILRELTAFLAPWHDVLIYAHTRMLFLDRIYAVSRWGIAQEAVYAETFTQEKSQKDAEKTLRLLQARHPLLGEKAVPIDVTFLPNTRVLIITGPNTGGKTVTLKTIALFALLNQSGFPLPAAHGTQMMLFDNVFADIGDEQSLDQSLSTFSAHIKNMAHMISCATENSLILLDELGSGTDPEEGGALAMAILDFFIEHHKPTILVTTHHGVIKHYGYMHEACTNASVEFDEKTLSATYRIVMGVPGESHALDIAGRNGMSDWVLQKARSYLQGEQADISTLIRSLTEKHAHVHELVKEQELERNRLWEKRRKVDLKELQNQQKELELRRAGYQKTEHFLSDSRRLLENLVRELREGEITREKTLRVKEYIAALDASIAEEKENLLREESDYSDHASIINEAEENSISDKKGDNTIAFAKAEEAVFKEGCDIIISAGKKRGTIVRKAKAGSWIVAVGALKITIKESDMRVLAPQARSLSSATVSIELAAASDNNVAAYELNLRGMRLDEALKSLERQVDLATLNGLRTFSIIHGKGSGILQQGISDYLKHNSAIATYTFARPEDGGSGKTYVTLR